MNQTDTQDYQYYLGCNAKRTVRLTFPEKNRISTGHIDLFAFSIFKNIEILLDQGVVQSEPHINIPDYQCYLKSNAQRMVRLTFQEKMFVFQTEIYYYFRIVLKKFTYK